MIPPMVGYLRQVASSPVGLQIKRRALELLDLAPGDSVVDVGCGPGIDTPLLARLVGPTGGVIGVDTSPEMVRHAAIVAAQQGISPWVEHRVGRATALPLPTASVDAWHSERVLQHLPGHGPLLALAEARRVLRRKARLVVVDTDWGSLSIAGPAVEVERRLVRLHAARFANGYVGRMLPRLVRQAGLVRTHVESFSATLTPASLDFVFNATVQAALASHVVTPLEWRMWRRGLEEFRASGDAIATVTLTLVGAKRP